MHQVTNFCPNAPLAMARCASGYSGPTLENRRFRCDVAQLHPYVLR